MNIESISIENLRARRNDLIKQNDSLRLRIEKLQAPARIESIAYKKLGMISPQERHIITLDEPLEPPKQAVESSYPEEDERLSSSKKSVGLSELLKRRGRSRGISQTHYSETAGRPSG